MTATNHALTGAIIGLAIGNPIIALPVALLSHFVCDAIPHYTDPRVKVGSQSFRNYLIMDMLGAVGVALFLVVVQPEHWFLACWTAFLATSPDLMWATTFIRSQKSGKESSMPSHWLARFHHRIQKYAQPKGIYIEYVWAFGALVILAKLTTI
jgi:hypothetical protein